MNQSKITNGPWCTERTEESTQGNHAQIKDPSNLRLIRLVEKCKICFWILESNILFLQQI